MKVEVRPLERKQWHGKKGKESFAAPKVVEALYNTNLGRLDTGLDEKEEKEYGIKLGVVLDSTYNPEIAHPVWSSKTFQVKLENMPQFFDTTKPLDFVKVKLMKASKYVANSMKEYEAGLFPQATHVIFDEEEEVALKATKIQQKSKAILVASKLSADEKINIVQVLSNKSLRGRSNDFIDVEIDNIIDTRVEDFMRYAKMDKQEVYVRAAILEAIHRNILTKEGSSIFYMGDVLGMDFESTVEWFINPQNAKIKVKILEQLNSK